MVKEEHIIHEKRLNGTNEYDLQDTEDNYTCRYKCLNCGRPLVLRADLNKTIKQIFENNHRIICFNCKISLDYKDIQLE